MKKPKPDRVDKIDVIDQDPPAGFHYLQVYRMQFQNHYPKGEISKPYFYETVVRRHFDAVAILLYESKDEHINVFLRPTLRPALATRNHIQNQMADLPNASTENPVVLEIVAGLLEEQDLREGTAGIEKRAVAEVWEEAGFKIKTSDLQSLGAPILPTPGMNPEKIYLFAAQVKSENAQTPPGDGSVVEDIGGIKTFSLRQALNACRSGEILDAKTQISLYRLAESQ